MTRIFNTDGLATDPDAREQWWDPADPRIFVPRAIGIGWDINLGAVAVKLGWIRPDDFDDDVLGAIPPQFAQGMRAALAATAGLAIGGSILAATRQDRDSDRGSAVADVIGVAAVTGFAATRTQRSDKLITGSIATGVNAAAGLKVLESLATSGGLTTALKVAQPLVLFGAPLGIVTRAIKAGLENVVDHSSQDRANV